jgi:hypothetical protein
MINLDKIVKILNAIDECSYWSIREEGAGSIGGYDVLVWNKFTEIANEQIIKDILLGKLLQYCRNHDYEVILKPTSMQINNNERQLLFTKSNLSDFLIEVGNKLFDLDKKFYKTVIKIEILSQDFPILEDLSLSDIQYDIEKGTYSGKTSTESVRELTKQQMKQQLEYQGSDPSFFGIGVEEEEK